MAQRPHCFALLSTTNPAALFLLILLAQAGARIRKLKGHKDYINSVAAPRQDKPLFVTGSDDRTVRLWDARRRGHVALLESKYQVTAVSFNGDVDEVISGGLDNEVKIWDLRKNEVVHRLKGHTGEAVRMDGGEVCFNPAFRSRQKKGQKKELRIGSLDF
jgi:WD40 repeat protein